MGLRRRLSSELNGNIQERKEIINLASVSRQKKKKKNPYAAVYCRR